MAHLVLTLLVAYAVLCAAAFLLQRKLTYLPGPAPRGTPERYGLEHEPAPLTTADGLRLDAWWITAREPWAAVLVAHGNAGTIEGRVHLARAYHDMGLSVLLFDYRGYGASEGEPGEEGLYLDAEAAYDELVRRLAAADLPPARAVAHGESLGGAVAIELARRRPLGAVVIESAFTSLPDVGARAYPFLPVRLLARERFDSLHKIRAGFETPLLVLHGRGDEIVPFEQGERLARAAGAPLVELAGGHNDGGFAVQADARARVAAFLRDALDVPEPEDAR